jgi:hypothetical protein
MKMYAKIITIQYGLWHVIIFQVRSTDNSIRREEHRKGEILWNH